MQISAIDGLANVRDLGGLRRDDGTITPTGVFIRAEMLDRVTPIGWHRLRDYGVRTVIDLRRPNERTGDVPSGVRRIDVDLDGADENFWAPFEKDGRWATPLYYVPHLHRMPQRLAAVFRAIASAEDGAVLFHCGAGWDRTGLVAAALLRTVKVEEDAAVADYMASFSNAAAMATLHGRSFEPEKRRETLARFIHTPESAFRAAYQQLDLDEWFDHAGIDLTTRLAVMTWRGSVASDDDAQDAST
ncbi:Tyrosine phosphatase family protein [Agreia bicolorata]|uniref:Tyrosine phosphatase family protein n=1 Tax=Agreia bicolorata TaxID=110935 RepID=A0A1T4X4V7_9MICO|nr:tyrosine-protein phosphatase [Agreia bicolorata]SKA84158.1 Tyrosine phosphatase family protein [Agreia bicolorata]